MIGNSIDHLGFKNSELVLGFVISTGKEIRSEINL
jgi:hypothetical protein